MHENDDLETVQGLSSNVFSRMDGEHDDTTIVFLQAQFFRHT